MSGGTTLAYPEFAAAYERAAPFTLLPRDRCEHLWKLACSAPSEGDFAEVGVYRGGSAMLLRAASPDRPIHLFDTFAGHPVPSAFDSPHHYAGKYADTDATDVVTRVGGKLAMWRGQFADIAPAFWAQGLALVHLDADLYKSTRDALARLVPLLIPGGIVVCDDYCEDDCPGVRKAIDEFLLTTTARLSSDLTSAGQAVLRRLA